MIAYAEAFLDEAVGLEGGKFSEVVEFQLRDAGGVKQFAAKLKDGREVSLSDGGKFAGYREHAGLLSNIFFKNNGLHIELRLDRNHPIGKAHRAGLRDVVLESAITTIQDCEDSVAAVDAADKARIYRNWTGIMKGTLTASLDKGGKEILRSLNPDVSFTAPDGKTKTLPGRSLLLVRNVGLHMHTDAVTTTDGKEIPEGFLDAMVTALAALHDLRRTGTVVNSRAGSVYIVKPKQHSPEEVAATVELFERVEDALGLKRNTLKLGIMDEERRLTVNLKEAIRAARRASSLSIPDFSTAPATKFIRAWSSVPCCPKWRFEISRGSPPTKIAMSISASKPGLPAERRSAKACGRCRTRCAR